MPECCWVGNDDGLGFMYARNERIYAAEKKAGKSTGKTLAMKKDALRRVDALSGIFF